MVRAITMAAMLGFLASTDFSHAEATSATFSYAFPRTKWPKPTYGNGGMWHGLCVLGAKRVTTTVSSPTGKTYGFRYTPIPDFRNRLLAFTRHHAYRIDGVNGGGDQVCEGGTFLQASHVDGPPSGVDIAVEAIAKDENTDVVLCAFLHLKNHRLNREGNWRQPLLDDGFIQSDRKLSYHLGRRYWTAYCKNLSEAARETSGSPTKAPSETPTKAPSDSPTKAPSGSPTKEPSGSPTKAPSNQPKHFPPTTQKVLAGSPTEPPTLFVDDENLWHDCPDDIRLKHTHGSTAFSTSAVRILSQDTKTVTVELNQAWDATVDKYFYSFQESVFSNQCYEEEGFAPGETLQPITLQCLATSPVTSLEICLQDTEGGLLSDADDAIVPKCCHSDAPVGTPTVCYNLEIMCETTCVAEESRMLRGQI